MPCSATRINIYPDIGIEPESNLSTKRDSETVHVMGEQTQILPLKSQKIVLNQPVLMAGFPDSGMIGSICINHLIEQLEMHQIASIESQYVMPAAIFIGGRFRQPFRIYSNISGTVCAVICEVPVLARGVNSTASAIIEWCKNVGVREIIALGGILPSNFSPSYLMARRPLLLQNDAVQATKAVDDGISPEMVVPNDAIIIGITGATLSISASHGLKCTALMIPTIVNGPDPEGAAIVLESLSRTSLKLKIDTSLLRQKVQEIRKHLQEYLKMHDEQMKQYEQSSNPEAGHIYK